MASRQISTTIHLYFGKKKLSTIDIYVDKSVIIATYNFPVPSCSL